METHKRCSKPTIDHCFQTDRTFLSRIVANAMLFSSIDIANKLLSYFQPYVVYHNMKYIYQISLNNSKVYKFSKPKFDRKNSFLNKQN